MYGWSSNAGAFWADPFQDWAVFHTAAAGYLRLGDWNQVLQTWPLPDHPWLYPPSFLLLLMPFAPLPWDFACLLFLLLTLQVLLVVVWRLAGPHRSFYTLALLLSPAAMVNVYLGQNGFLTGALLIGGGLVLKRRPVLAGVLFGLLAIKPQLGLMVPVALIATRDWKALSSAIVTGAALLLVSALVFGLGSWESWIAMTTATGDLSSPMMIGRLHGNSIFTCVMLLGASPTIANTIQLLATVLAAATVFVCWRSPMSVPLRLAVLLAATVIAAPHVTSYDSIILAFAASLVFVDSIEHGWRPVEMLLALLVWASPLINPPMFNPIGRMTPLLIASFIGLVIARGLRVTPPIAVPTSIHSVDPA